jgi:cytochrome P450
MRSPLPRSVVPGDASDTRVRRERRSAIMRTGKRDTGVTRTAPRRIPLIGNALLLVLKNVDYMASLYEHGDVVVLYLGTRPVYVLAGPEAVHRALVVEAKHFDKGLLFDRVRPFFGNGIVTSSGDFHRHQRRVLQSAFSRERVTAYGEVFARVMGERITSWQPGTVAMMDDEMRTLSAYALVSALFAPDWAGEISEEVNRYLPVLVRGALFYTVFPGWFRRIPVRWNREFFEGAERLHGVVGHAIAKRRSGVTDEPDLLSVMLAGGMNDEQARDEVLTMLLAGIETTGTTLSWACYELGRQPSLAAELRHEVLAGSWQPGHAVGSEDLPRTERFLKEVLRLHQPNWILMRRARVDVDLGSMVLPAGAEVLYSPAAIHRNPEIFTDPLRFDPDRWLRTPTPPRGSYLPFSLGLRQCIGDTFAWAELRTAMATISAKWRLTPKPGHSVRTVAGAQLHPNSLPMIPEPWPTPRL